MSYYDRDGTPVGDVRDWVRSRESDDSRVALTKVTGGNPPRTYDISTVYLGLDHGFGGGPPLIFESMVFGLDDDEMMDRYSTEAQAREGHTAMVVQVAAMVSNPVVLDIDPADASTKPDRRD